MKGTKRSRKIVSFVPAGISPEASVDSSKDRTLRNSFQRITLREITPELLLLNIFMLSKLQRVQLTLTSSLES